jgi:hypothetical protein
LIADTATRRPRSGGSRQSSLPHAEALEALGGHHDQSWAPARSSRFNAEQVGFVCHGNRRFSLVLMMRPRAKCDIRVHSTYSSVVEVSDAMDLDARAIENAERALSEYLSAEAEQQRAYVFRFPDGRISLELEWLDIRSVAQAVVTAYVNSLAEDGSRSADGHGQV